MVEFHTPVLLNEAIEYLNVKSGEKYIDATLGGGGHSGRINEKGGNVLSLDQDAEAVAHTWEKFKTQNSKTCPREGGDPDSKIYEVNNNWILVKCNFAEIEEIGKETGFKNVAGILFDLGLSSHQLEDESRGFSFDSDDELDMRMDKDLGVKASVLVNGLTKKELERIFLEYGEEEMAWKIAPVIVKTREKKPVTTCRQLAEICKQVKGDAGGKWGMGRKIHPATQVFQALRIVINDELGSLEKGLSGSFNILRKDGRLVVISFHSLEDRIIKKTFRTWQNDGKGEILTEQIVTPSEKEILSNPRSRSAKLRVFKKV